MIRFFDGKTYATDPARVGAWKFADGKWWAYAVDAGSSSLPLIGLKCPYGEVGDTLWVRETWAPRDDHTIHNRDKTEIFYRADDETNYESDCGWRPSIFLPRWACRLTLKITNVRIERLRDITEGDAIAEGIRRLPGGGFGLEEPFSAENSAIEAFHVLWDSINAKRGFGWHANPWVWVITFKRLGD